jgi:hypothetical protein
MPESRGAGRHGAPAPLFSEYFQSFRDLMKVAVRLSRNWRETLPDMAAVQLLAKQSR